MSFSTSFRCTAHSAGVSAVLEPLGESIDENETGYLIWVSACVEPDNETAIGFTLTLAEPNSCELCFGCSAAEILDMGASLGAYL